MIGPVSGTGRAMMASLQQAIQKGMPPDQAVQYVKSMATQGVAPLTDLYAMLNQFQRLKQQPVQAPQTPPTIRDQLNMMEQQQAMMQQGVASLPAPVMDQAQFAGGGIVAFAAGSEEPVSSGGGVGRSYYENLDFMRATPEERKVIRAMKKAPFARTAQDIEVLKQAGFEFSENRGFPEDSAVMRLNRALESPFIRGSTATLSDEELAQMGGTGAINEKIYRALGGSRYVPPAAAPPAAPSAAPTGALTPFSPGAFRPGTGNALDLMRYRELAAERPAPPRDDTTPRVPAPPRDTVAPPAAVEKERTLAELRAEELAGREAYKKEKGIGSADRELLSFLSDENNRLAEQFGRNKMFAFAEAGFKMAAAASRPGATFLGALSEGAISGTQALQGLQREMDANRRGLKEAMLKLRKADELEQMGDYDKAGVLAQQARTELFERKKHADSMNMDARRLAVIVRGQDMDYRAATARAIAQGEGRSASGNINILRLQRENLELDYVNQQNIANDLTRSEAERLQARANMGLIRKKMDELVSGATLSGAGASQNPYADFTVEEEGG